MTDHRPTEPDCDRCDDTGLDPEQTARAVAEAARAWRAYREAMLPAVRQLVAAFGPVAEAMRAAQAALPAHYALAPPANEGSAEVDMAEVIAMCPEHGTRTETYAECRCAAARPDNTRGA